MAIKVGELTQLWRHFQPRTRSVSAATMYRLQQSVTRYRIIPPRCSRLLPEIDRIDIRRSAPSGPVW
jgi:hypothetical protein